MFLSGHAFVSSSVREQTLLFPDLTTVKDPSSVAGLGRESDYGRLIIEPPGLAWPEES